MTLIMDRERTDYTLRDINHWLGIDVRRSGTLMEDCFVTAQVFLKLLDLLAEKGIRTLGELTEASRRVAEEKRKQSS